MTANLTYARTYDAAHSENVMNKFITLVAKEKTTPIDSFAPSEPLQRPHYIVKDDDSCRDKKKTTSSSNLTMLFFCNTLFIVSINIYTYVHIFSYFIPVYYLNQYVRNE